MDLSLAEVAAGLPMALSLALAGGIATIREGRRRSTLNEAMHELRRPLQALSLAVPADPARARALDSSLQMAVAALERLDREINGVAEADGREWVKVAPFVGAAARRWEAHAAAAGRSLRMREDAAAAMIRGSETQLAQAVDNMISNALEHGSGEIVLEARLIDRRVRVAVLDEGSGERGGNHGRPGLRSRLSGRCRHGHGLRVIGRVAQCHGGTFRLRHSNASTEARLELPLDRSGAGA